MKAAFQSAQQNMATKSDGGSSGSSGGGLSSAMGTAKNFVADMGKSLAQGASHALKQSAGPNESFMGKVASHIKSEMSGGEKASQAGMPNAVGGNAKDEIAAFVNKNT